MNNLLATAAIHIQSTGCTSAAQHQQAAKGQEEAALVFPQPAGAWVFAVLLLLFISGCGGGGGGSGSGPFVVRSSNSPGKVGITIDNSEHVGGSTTDSASLRLTGQATIDNKLPDYCLGLNCSTQSSSCRVCSSDTRVSWRNQKTGESGQATTRLAKGKCVGGGLFGCPVYTAWQANICLAPGKNRIRVSAYGPRKGTASETVAITLNGTPESIVPVAPKLRQLRPSTGEITLNWSANPSQDKATHYRIYLAESPWTQWSDSLPGARQSVALYCCSHTVRNLLDGVSYGFALSAENCVGEGAISIPQNAIPGSTPTSIVFLSGQKDLTTGTSRVLNIQVRDSAGHKIPDLVIDWASSDESVATLQPEALPTNSEGVASATITALAPGEVTISVAVSETDIWSSITIDVSEPDPVPPDSDPVNEGKLLTAPTLLTPVSNAVIEQGRSDLACASNSPQKFGYRISFDWTDAVAIEGIAGYHLYATHQRGVLPLVDSFVRKSQFTLENCESYVADSALDDWQWQVQPEDILGNLGPVSELGVFRFAPCFREDGRPCSE
jgi:hypothetical protein